jgi:hypothetical protein
MSTAGEDDDDPDEAQLGEVPEGLGADLYPRHLEYLSKHEAFQDAVLSLPDADGAKHDVALDQVTDADSPSQGAGKSRIRLRNGAIVLASGAVIAVAIATVRYRRKHK